MTISTFKKRIRNKQSLGYTIDLNTKILEAGIHIDVVFETKQGVLGAHRCILANASPVLKKMMEDPGSPMSMDMSLPALRAFLMLVYTKQYDRASIQENGLEILAACVKYELPSLVRVCAPILRSSLSLDNCLSYAEAAAMYDDELYRACRRFVCKHFDYVVMSDAYEDLAGRKPSLAVELVRGTVEEQTWPRLRCCWRIL